MGVLKRDFFPDDLAPLLESRGVRACVAVQVRQSRSENDFLLELAARHDFISGVVGWIDFQDPELEAQLQAYQAFEKLKGFRHLVEYEPDDDFLLKETFVEGVRALEKTRFTYDILVLERQLSRLPHFLARFDGQPFVLDHLGKPDIQAGVKPSWRALMHEIAAYPNLYCKLSGLVTEAAWQRWKPEDFYPFLEVVTDAFGPHRLLFGSDWPVCLCAAPGYASVCDLISGFYEGYPQVVRDAIFSDNTKIFYNLEL